MAAYGALVSLLRTLDTKLHPISLQNSPLEPLRSKLIFLQQFLENYPEITTISQEPAENIETLIRKAAYKAEDLIESQMYKDHNSKPIWRPFLYSVLNFLFIFSILVKFVVINFMPRVVDELLPDVTQLIFVYCFLRYAVGLIPKWLNFFMIKNVGRDLLQVLGEFESITEEVIKIKDQYFGVSDHRPTGQDDHALPVADSGRAPGNDVECDLGEIRDELTGASSKLQMVSVVGMGGIGKTTLARKVFDDSYVVYHFHVRAWVAVSRECSLHQVMLGLLDSMGILVGEMSNERDGELCERLYKSLKGRRYLVVMDDMWGTEIWDEVRRFFPNDCNGSRVLLTTRLLDVARYANSVFLHEMRFLSEDESWSLLCRKVFLGGEKDCPLELKEVGKEIARNCGGLPLAIVVIGGLLHKGEKIQEYWRRISKNLNSIITKDKRCMEILSLSYNHLPHHLRPCFLYMGVFPEDCEIPIPKLVRLWVAEGFLKRKPSKRFEELAEEYLEDLIKRNLIMVSKRSCNGKIKTCNIHDLLRDLCIGNARMERFLDVVKDNSDHGVGINTPRRLNVFPNVLESPPSTLYNAHSLLCGGTYLIFRPHIYLGYRLLRVLDVAIVHFARFPIEIVKLVNLRYLAFTYIGTLPASISNLRNLQTIILHDWTYQFFALPVEIWTMTELRHLCVPPSFFPDARGAQFIRNNLKNLQTLLEVGNFRCGLDILKRIRNIKSLGLSYNVEMVSFRGWSAYKLENIAYLRQLETLKILISSSDALRVCYPLKLTFPKNLRRLTLHGCGLPWDNMTIVGALPNLEVLRLRRKACIGISWRPVEGQFCQLKFLLLQQIDLVEWWLMRDISRVFNA